MAARCGRVGLGLCAATLLLAGLVALAWAPAALAEQTAADLVQAEPAGARTGPGGGHPGPPGRPGERRGEPRLSLEAAGAPAPAAPEESGAPDPRWGLLAGGQADGQELNGAYFFAGNWRQRPEPHQFYEYPTTPNDQLYTMHPQDPLHLGWSERREFRDAALGQMVDAGVNVVVMSSWGERGTDRWASWSPMQTSPAAHDELFEAAPPGLQVMPAIESGAATGHSPAYVFGEDFPGTPTDPAPMLVRGRRRRPPRVARRRALLARPRVPDETESTLRRASSVTGP